MKDIKVAIQYPSFGPQHPPRLEAIYERRPTPDSVVVAMEMFRKDSDYEWRPVRVKSNTYQRYTVVDDESASARKKYGKLREEVFRALDDISPDVLVVNGWGHRESRISLDWCRKNRCGIVILSDSVRENRVRFWPLELYKKWLLRGIRAGFAAGTPQARYLKYLGIPPQNIFHPGSCVVDNDYWYDMATNIRGTSEIYREKFGLPERYFLSVARFLDWKNIPFLIRSYDLYKKEEKDNAIDLVICGSGSDEDRIRAEIERLKLSSVHLHGFRQVDELPVYYGLASCFILPSCRFECWGFVVNEAMASGLPVLVSNMVGSAEDLVTEGVNGHTFDPNNEEELAILMSKVVSDEKERMKMGKKSLRMIGGHNTEIAAENLWKAVKAALEIV